MTNLVTGLRKARGLVAHGWHAWFSADAAGRMAARQSEECVAWCVNEALRAVFGPTERDVMLSAMDVLETLRFTRKLKLPEDQIGDYGETNQAEALQLLDRAILRAIAITRSNQ